jgi:hypothetical protein
VRRSSIQIASPMPRRVIAINLVRSFDDVHATCRRVSRKSLVADFRPIFAESEAKIARLRQNLAAATQSDARESRPRPEPLDAVWRPVEVGLERARPTAAGEAQQFRGVRQQFHKALLGKTLTESSRRLRFQSPRSALDAQLRRRSWT